MTTRRRKAESGCPWRNATAMLALNLLAFAQLATPARGAEPIENPWILCRSGAEAATRTRDLPPPLLEAIALTESGRWNAAEGETLAWPWTVMAGGRGQFLPSKGAAVETVRILQARRPALEAAREAAKAKRQDG